MMTQLMTAAPVISEPPQRIPTGNLEISLPSISRLDGGVYSIGALMMKANALIEVAGSEALRQPLLAPCLELDGKPLELKELIWQRIDHWIPQFTAWAGSLKVKGTIFTPLGEKGFVYLLEIQAEEAVAGLEAGLQGWWHGVDTIVFTTRRLESNLRLWHDPWSRSLVGEACTGLPLIAWGLQASFDGRLQLDGSRYHWSQTASLAPGEKLVLAFYCSLNLESDGARTGALHLRRRGWQALLAETRQWLASHQLHLAQPALERTLNENLFFNFFYSQGKCLDNGELALVTSRSSSYYVCAAYWARDALLWSLPGLLLVDRQQAQSALAAAWGRYLPHGAHHALYINGENLYPGFELDQACAPLLAAGHYLAVTQDWDFISRLVTPQNLHQVEANIAAHYVEKAGLYGTFLTPHDDPTSYPFLTCNNVLVWRALTLLADFWEKSGERQVVPGLRQKAAQLKQQILVKCVIEGPFGPQFAGAVDEAGRQELVDLPGASWSLFPLYRFCPPDDARYLNSLKWISSASNPYYYPGAFGGAGAAHFPYPSSFDLANRLWCKDPKAIAQLGQLAMDHGLCCESYDAETGIVKTGAAFATMAGFLGYCLFHSQKDILD